MVVGIVGSRDYPDLFWVRSVVEALARKHPDAVVVSGGAQGVDLTAEDAVRACGLAVVSYRPYRYDSVDGHDEWSIETVTYGDAAQALVVAKHRRISPPYFRTFAQAAFHRNGWIVEDAARLLAFWDGVSTGTADTLRKARVAGVPDYVYLPPRLGDVVAYSDPGTAGGTRA